MALENSNTSESVDASLVDSSMARSVSGKVEQELVQLTIIKDVRINGQMRRFSSTSMSQLEAIASLQASPITKEELLREKRIQRQINAERFGFLFLIWEKFNESLGLISKITKNLTEFIPKNGN